MLLPASYPSTDDDLCFLELRPVRFPLFTTGYPPFVNEKAVKQAGIVELDFMPVLYERGTLEWYIGRGEDPIHELLLFFDLDEYDVSIFGPLRGDVGLEAMIGRHMAQIFPPQRFGHPEYTNYSEQSDDYVSLRYPLDFGRGLSRQLRKDPKLLEDIERNPLVIKAALITPMMAERYRQSVGPEVDADTRPAVPAGLSAGLRI